MQIYHYDPATLLFAGTGEADPSPREKGVFLLPAHSTELEPPEFDPEAEFCRFVDGAWLLEPIPAPPPPEPPTVAELLSHSALLRWKREAAGVVVGGRPVPGDDRTRGVVNAAFVRASADPDYSIPNWKVGPGEYVTLTAADVLAVAAALEAHVAECFDLNAAVDGAILAGEITTLEAVVAAYS